MKSAFSKLAALWLLLLPLSNSHLLAFNGYVSRQGTNFVLAGKPFFFAGANCYDLFTYGGGSDSSSSNAIENSYMDKNAIDTQMARMQADGVTVVRTWGFNHLGTWHVFEASKGNYNEAEFREFDYILNSASNHNIRLIVALENYWADYGGIDTRLSWEGLTGGDPGRRKFFTNTPAIQGYKNYVQYFLNRTNHYTGTQYKKDQTIFAWEVMNEPRYQGESSTENVAGTKLRAWMDNVGAFIKGIDTNHLLGTGMEGLGSSFGYGGDVGAPFVNVQQSTNIDFCSAHVYPANGSLSVAQTTNLVIAWGNAARGTVGKPFFLGEFNVSSATRSNYWSAIYSTILAQNISASAFWWYEEANIDSTYGVQQGAPELALFSANSSSMQAKSGGVSTLGSFAGGLHGAYPNQLVRGSDGQLYGTTQSGGTNGFGTVFVVDSNGQPVDLYSFTGSDDGAYPLAGLIQGADGNFYGTTYGGGTSGNGTVFRMTTGGAVNGIYSFTGGSDGANPYAALTQAADGSLLVVTYYGGTYGNGTIFRMTTNGSPISSYSFQNYIDGANPDAALVQGADGNFYGTASAGGQFGNGSVFKLAADGTVTRLYSFTGGSDGRSPDAPLVQGNDGNFYGVTSYGGGANPSGTIFRIPPGGVPTILHALAGGNEGLTPYGSLLQLSDGNFYGTTTYGGPYNDGTLFSMTPGGAVTNLAWFNSYNGANPETALVLGTDGALYGTTLNGGVYDSGTIFRITVPLPPARVTTSLGLATTASPSTYGNPVT
ncbi:MAG TPA: choice-of-anchor tandem repeat GloVer-containing protein, partial [Verrucomicrobiae bacterium]|nr:choice-of-anchor tandem repeat GloVer-containing protein [Verrucomicrobiae bacterium]